MKQRESDLCKHGSHSACHYACVRGYSGFVHEMTSEPIELSRAKAQTDAIASVLAGLPNWLQASVKIMPDDGSDSIEIFPAYLGDKLVALAVKTYSNNGFSGHISLMAGIDTLGNFTGYEVLEHKETPGLGSKMGEWFRSPEKAGQNVIGKNPAKVSFRVKKDGGDIDAITASTITSRAFLEALNRAHAGFSQFNRHMALPWINQFNKKVYYESVEKFYQRFYPGKSDFGPYPGNLSDAGGHLLRSQRTWNGIGYHLCAGNVQPGDFSGEKPDSR